MTEVQKPNIPVVGAAVVEKPRPNQKYKLQKPLRYEAENVVEIEYKQPTTANLIWFLNNKKEVGDRFNLFASQIAIGKPPDFFDLLSAKDYSNFVIGKIQKFFEVNESAQITENDDGSWELLLEYPTKMTDGVVYEKLTFARSPTGKFVRDMLNKADKKQGEAFFAFCEQVSNEKMRIADFKLLHMSDGVAIKDFLENAITPEDE
jgi:hypothetical protein